MSHQYTDAECYLFQGLGKYINTDPDAVIDQSSIHLNEQTVHTMRI